MAGLAHHRESDTLLLPAFRARRRRVRRLGIRHPASIQRAPQPTLFEIAQRSPCPHSECWNNCWNLKFQIGPNQSSFMAGHHAFAAEIPQAPTFALVSGTLYLFEAWDGKGRVRSERFRL